MLEYVGEHKVKSRIERAVWDVLEEGKHLTGDLGGSANTAGFTDAIIDSFEGGPMSDTKTHAVTLIPGDWIGPETVAVTQRVIEALGVSIDWDTQECHGDEVPDSVLASARRTGTVLKGKVGAQREQGRLPATVVLRKELKTWATVRPVQALPGANARAIRNPTSS